MGAGMIGKFLPLVMELGKYLSMGLDHYADLREARKAADPEIICAFLRVKIDRWDPEVSGRKILDPVTKDAGARFLAGIACNVAGMKP
jgi:hypothetical protein